MPAPGLLFGIFAGRIGRALAGSFLLLLPWLFLLLLFLLLLFLLLLLVASWLENGRQGNVCLVEKLKITASRRISGIEIGMQLKGALAVGLFQILKAGAFFQMQNLVTFLET